MKLVVLGAGESGVGAAILAKQKGYDVFVSDKGEIDNKYKEVLVHKKIEFEDNCHSKHKIFNTDIVVKSPGIPEDISLIKDLKLKGIKIISEIEFAFNFTDACIIGVTGSNGKTTTSMLTYHLLNNSKLNVGIAGNIGKSFAMQVASSFFDTYVLELSSFQLDGIFSFKPKIAMVLNISPDHLDRYDNNYKKYIDSKFRITKNQTNDDFLIYSLDDKSSVDWIKKNKTRAKLVPFSIKKELEYGAYLKDNKIIIKVNEENFTMSVSKLTIQGNHNIKNAMASMLAAKLSQVRNKSVIDSMSSFEGVEHRLEKFMIVNGVEYINDSKATNVNATFYALECMDKPTVWILGGIDKGNDYTELISLVREKVKAIICLGKNNSKIIKTFENLVEVIVETTNINKAVKVSQNLTEKGDVVLLSPACASFDLFKNYQERGNKFKEAIKNL